jgi:hypothetical protein
MFMKSQKRIFGGGLVAASLAIALLGMVGCSKEGSAGESPASTAQRVEAATKMRSYFDKSNGNFDALSPDDKAALNSLTGSEKKSREAFGHMALPGRGGLPASGPDSH